MLAAPAIVKAQAPIRWRLQTYSGAPLGAHVIKPQIDAFNAAANGEMEIELYYADQLVPTGELFRALQNGTLDAVQSDEATMASPVDISVFGGYFPFATRYSLDVASMFMYYGLDEIWNEAYSEVNNVTWLSTGAWDPLHIFTVDKPIRSLADMNGLRVFGVPTAGRFLSRYGLIPVTVPWDDVEVAMRTGELDGVAWCGFTEAYEVGWADVCNYALTNSSPAPGSGRTSPTPKAGTRCRRISSSSTSRPSTSRTTTATSGTGAARRSCAWRARRWS
jgi:TRAP-type C4-dicarboxylate transport system substrate-binding protein